MGKVFHSEATSLDVRSFLSAKFSTSLLSSDNTTLTPKTGQSATQSADSRGGAKIAYVAIRSLHKFMQRSHVAISCSDQMSISSVGFPSFAVQYFSIFGNLYLSLPFSVGFPVFCCEAFLKIGILHLRMLFWVGFPISTVGYFPKLVTHICQCLFR